jgi:tRNA U34 5-methylaminomethyl-2-thiouridine-forming methyltransferase MnmC
LSAYELVTLKSGVKSLRSVERGETYHPVTGPRLEARILHIEQARLVERCAESASFVIWDVGFGAAANALTAIEALQEQGAKVELHSFDRTTAAIEFALQHAHELEYVLGHEAALQRLLTEGYVELASGLRWHFHLGDFRDSLASPEWPAPHAIFYDPYSPAKNPEMWTLDHFRRLRARIGDDTPCLLTNYTCSTAVRATLLLAGFHVGVGCGVGEKVQTTLATNRLDLLQQPLGSDWIRRVRVSCAAAPLRGAAHTAAPIQGPDLAALLACPQFATQFCST